MGAWAVAVHGGVGNWKGADEGEALAGVRRSAAAAVRVLASGGRALDAVIAAVVVLEDAPVFNAGTGSVLNLRGEVEMDAAVMDGEGRRFGGVAALPRVRNPVLVARKVMEETEHVLLAGEGALRFARALGFVDYDPVTEARRAQWRRLRRGLADGRRPRLQALLANWPGVMGDTVGAVALDRNGHLAAATSTGGVALKLPGRVGDTPVPGAGTYASTDAAVSATGMGELILRFVTAKTIADAIAEGQGAQQATETVLAAMAAQAGREVGAVSVDKDGHIGIAHLTQAMPCAWAEAGKSTVNAVLKHRHSR
jgi:beta-aspartyl-peptidase (threonine type)